MFALHWPDLCRSSGRSRTCELISIVCGFRRLRDKSRNRCAVLQVLNALTEDTLEFGEAFFVSARRFRQLQLTEDVLERGNKVLGL